jgi:hypothetical protein
MKLTSISQKRSAYVAIGGIGIIAGGATTCQ